MTKEQLEPFVGRVFYDDFRVLESRTVHRVVDVRTYADGTPYLWAEVVFAVGTDYCLGEGLEFTIPEMLGRELNEEELTMLLLDLTPL